MWTANKQPATTEHTLIVQTVVFTNDADGAKIQLIYKTEAVDYAAPWPDALINRQLAVLNATVDIKTIPTGAPQPEPVITPPTPDPASIAQFQLDMANAQLVRLKGIADAQEWASTQTDPVVVDVLQKVNTAETTLITTKPVTTGGIAVKG